MTETSKSPVMPGVFPSPINRLLAPADTATSFIPCGATNRRTTGRYRPVQFSS